MSTCPHCGIGFKAFKDYQEHLVTHSHAYALESSARGLVAHSRMVSGRSKAQIVAEAESTWLSPYIITASNEAEHLEACRCQKCWHKMADKLIQTQEKWL
jgi:uncharacterized C2H2 Zn-finger protein